MVEYVTMAGRGIRIAGGIAIALAMVIPGTIAITENPSPKGAVSSRQSFVVGTDLQSRAVGSPGYSNGNLAYLDNFAISSGPTTPNPPSCLIRPMTLVSFTPTTSYGPMPRLTVTFNATTLCGGSAYSVTWVYGDGNKSAQSAANASWSGAWGQEQSFVYSHTYTYIGSFIARIWIIDGAGTNVSGSTPIFVSFTPSLFYSFFNESGLIGNGVNGSTYSIGLVEECDNTTTYTPDIRSFDTQFGLPSATLHFIGPGSNNSRCGLTGWGKETDLDIEWAHVAAPGAQIYVCLANETGAAALIECDQTFYTHRNGTADNTMIVSNSWEFCGVGHSVDQATGQSLCTNAVDPYHGDFATYKSAGMNVLASTGDFAPYPPCDLAGYPSSDPAVLAVGGTTVTSVTKSGGYGAEKSWYNGTLPPNPNVCFFRQYGAAQDEYPGELVGTNSYYGAPSWQASVLNNTDRYFPDVSMVANSSTGVPIVYHGGWRIVGGTSIGSPIWAGILDVLFQAAAPGLSGFAAAFLYNNAACFHGIANPYYGVDGLGAPNVGCLSRA